MEESEALEELTIVRSTSSPVTSVATSPAGIVPIAENAKFDFRGHAAKVLSVQQWPAELPLLHPRVAWKLLDQKVERREIRNIMHKYENSFTGEDVVDVLCSEEGFDEFKKYRKMVVEFLEQCGVIVAVGHGKSFFSKTQRLFRLVDLEETFVNTGALFIRVDGAEGLLAESISGTSNTSATIHLGDTSISTATIRRDLNPQWQANFVFIVAFNKETSGSGTFLHLVGGSQKPETASPSPKNRRSLPRSRKPLAISVHVHAHRMNRTKTNIGQTKEIYLDQIPTHDKTTRNIEALPQKTYILKRLKYRDTNVLLAARAGFRGNKIAKREMTDETLGNSSSRNASSKTVVDCSDFKTSPKSPMLKQASIHTSIDRGDLSDFSSGDDGGDEEDEVDEDDIAANLLRNSIEKNKELTQEKKKHAHSQDSGSAASERRRTREDSAIEGNTKMGEICMRLLWVQTCEYGASSALVRSPSTNSEPNAQILDDGGTDTGSVSEGEKKSSNRSLLRHLSRSMTGELPSFETAPKKPGDLKRQTSRLNRFVGLRKKSNSTRLDLTTDGTKNASGEEKGISREVQFLEARRKAEQGFDERRAAMEEAMQEHHNLLSKGSAGTNVDITETRNYLEDMPRAVTKLLKGTESKEEKEAAKSVRCFLFDRTAKAFELLAVNNEIPRSNWVLLAPLMPPLCCTFNAHEVFDALLQAQLGKKLNRIIAMSGQLRTVRYPVFFSFVMALRSEQMYVVKNMSRLKSEFPEMNNRFGGDEIALRIAEKVRGGREMNNGYRKSQYGGRLVVSTEAVYFTKKHRFHANELQRIPMRHATQVLESNGSVDYGLMVGFSMKDLNVSESTSMQGKPLEMNPSQTQQEDIFEEFLSNEESEGEVVDALIGEEVSGMSEDDEVYHRNKLEEVLQTPFEGVTSSSEKSDQARPKSVMTESNSKHGEESKPFALKIPKRIIAKYAVFRFPSYSTWKKRDVDILIIRDVIACQILCELVIRPIFKQEVDHVIWQDENLDEEVFLEKVFVHARREVLVRDVISFKALVRMSEKRDWEWLDWIDTFEAFGDKWSWKRWTPMALLDIICSAAQPMTKKNSKLILSANLCLHALALQLIRDVAEKSDLQIEWAKDVSKRVSGRHGEPETQKNLMFRNEAEVFQGKNLRRCLDTWWLDFSAAMQTDIVRSAAKLKSLGQNVELFKTIMEPLKLAILEVKDFFHAVITWESVSLTVLLGFVMLCLILTGYTAYSLGIVSGSIGLYSLQLRSIRRKQGFRKLYVPLKQKKTLLEKYRGIKVQYQYVKKFMQRLNIFLLRFRAIFTWENESVTFKFTMLIFAITFVLLFAPRMFYELFIWAFVFTKKFRSGRTSRRIKAYILNEWNQVPPTALWEKDEPVHH